MNKRKHEKHNDHAKKTSMKEITNKREWHEERKKLTREK